MKIRTNRLVLVPGSRPVLEAELEGRAALARALQADVPGTWPPEHYDRPAVEHTLRLLEDSSQAGWVIWYLLVSEGGTRRAVGTAGFKGKPNADGEVEIGYSLLPEFQKKGLATEAVKGLLDHAWTFDAVLSVIAETLPSLPASIRLLKRIGFCCEGAGSEVGALRYRMTRPVEAG